jgi:hypothetical protein
LTAVRRVLLDFNYWAPSSNGLQMVIDNGH